jgi:hypothetical protein
MRAVITETAAQADATVSVIGSCRSLTSVGSLLRAASSAASVFTYV